MKEKDFQTKFTHWADKNLSDSSAFELKISHASSLAWDHLEKYQERSLFLARTKRIFHKISDASFERKPFDCFCLAGVPAYVVVYFYTKRGKDEFIMIDILDWIKFRDEKLLTDKKGCKSITEDEAKTIGTLVHF